MVVPRLLGVSTRNVNELPLAGVILMLPPPVVASVPPLFTLPSMFKAPDGEDILIALPLLVFLMLLFNKSTVPAEIFKAPPLPGANPGLKNWKAMFDPCGALRLIAPVPPPVRDTVPALLINIILPVF